jgi:hypothetical protein
MVTRQPAAPACRPHAITPACSVECLDAVLFGTAFNPLARAQGVPFGPPGTVGDVIGLYRQRRLGEIRGLGSRLIGQIEASLVSAGLIALPAPAAGPADGAATGPPAQRAIKGGIQI